jgi:predicted TIM-barrel fold metal-dependent hydrolase
VFDGELIDVHSHVFPDARSRKWFTDAYPYAGVEPDHALVASAKQYIREAGLNRLNLLLLFPSGYHYFRGTSALAGFRDQTSRNRGEKIRQDVVQKLVDYNEFGVNLVNLDPHFECFIGLDPILMEPTKMMIELEDKIERGAKGVKLAAFEYPAPLDDKRLDLVYDYCQAKGVPILHAPSMPCLYRGTGWTKRFGHPLELAAVYTRFPRLKTCFAHLSNPRFIRDLRMRYPGVYADLSEVLLHCSTREARDQVVADIRMVGAERVLFGTNFGGVHPFADGVTQALIFRQLPLKAGELRMIAGENYLHFIEHS